MFDPLTSSSSYSFTSFSLALTSPPAVSGTKPVIESTSPPKCHGVTMETHPAIIMSWERAGELRGDAAGHQCLLMMTPGSVSLSEQMCQTGRGDVILIHLNANKIIRSYLTEPLGL